MPMLQVIEKLQILNGNLDFFWNKIHLVGNFLGRDYEIDKVTQYNDPEVTY